MGDLRVTRGGEVKKLRRDVPTPPPGAGGRPAASPTAARPDSSFTPPAKLSRRPRSGRRCPGPSGSPWSSARPSGGSTRPAARSRPRARSAALTGSAYDGPTRNLARWLGARGPALTVTTACASGATSLGLGADLLRTDQADVVLAGGGGCPLPLRPARLQRAALADAGRRAPVRPAAQRAPPRRGRGPGRAGARGRRLGGGATGRSGIFSVMPARPTAPTSPRRTPRGAGSSSPCAPPSRRRGSRRTRWIS